MKNQDDNEILKDGYCEISKISLYESTIQFWKMNLNHLLNKPCVNEVTLKGQNPPLKYCQSLELLTQLEKDIDLSMLKIWGL